nr:MAG TPA_asm: hypothetical protein [Caudoviricetes sp.]
MYRGLVSCNVFSSHKPIINLTKLTVKPNCKVC